MRIAGAAAFCLLLALAAATASAASASNTASAVLARPGYTGSADFVQHLGERIPAGLAFRDEHGTAVRLERYLGSAPVALILTYYRCTNLCPMQVRKLAQRIAAAPGGAADAQVIVVSIDPLDTPALADRAKQQFLEGLLPVGAADRWHFLSGAQPEIAALAEALGFRYGYDEATRQFAHPAGFAMITADGKISRYFFGFDYTAADLSAAFDAGRGASASPRRSRACCWSAFTTTSRPGATATSSSRRCASPRRSCCSRRSRSAGTGCAAPARLAPWKRNPWILYHFFRHAPRRSAARSTISISRGWPCRASSRSPSRC